MTTSGRGPGEAKQSGFSLMYVVVAITVMASLATGLMSLVGTSVNNEVVLDEQIQARMLAQSGINYALQYAREVGVLTPGLAMTDLNGLTLNSTTSGGNLAANQQITLTVVPPTYGYDYTITAKGTVNPGSNFEANYVLTNLVNATGTFIQENVQGTMHVNTTGIIVNASTLHDYSGGASFDARLTGSAALASVEVSPGVYTTGNGIRVFFNMAFPSSSSADGFIFTFRSAGNSASGTAGHNTVYDLGGPDNSGESVCPGQENEGSSGCYMAYAGPGYPTWGNGMGIRPPKIGVQFDVYKNPGWSGAGDNFGRNDPSESNGDNASNYNGNTSIVYWGSWWNITAECTNACVPGTSGQTACGARNNSAYPTYDDNVHGAGGSGDDPLNPPAPGTQGTSTAAFHEFTNRNQIVADGTSHNVRIEICRGTTPQSGGANNGKYKYVTTMWYDCNSSGAGANSCQDVTVDFTGSNYSHKITDTMYLTPAQHDLFTTFIYGYTAATGAGTNNPTLTYPKIGMKTAACP